MDDTKGLMGRIANLEAREQELADLKTNLNAFVGVVKDDQSLGSSRAMARFQFSGNLGKDLSALEEFFGSPQNGNSELDPEQRFEILRSSHIQRAARDQAVRHHRAGGLSFRANLLEAQLGLVKNGSAPVNNARLLTIENTV